MATGAVLALVFQVGFDEWLKMLERVKGIEPTHSAWKSGKTVAASKAVLTFSVFFAH
jgi:hypothetical protein